jgi:hypothetical protein
MSLNIRICCTSKNNLFLILGYKFRICLQGREFLLLSISYVFVVKYRVLDVHVFLFVAARENAIVVNLEFVKAIITAEEVYFLDPMNRDVKPFVEQLRMQLPPQNILRIESGGQVCTTEDGINEQLPFEFRILEIALDVVCNHLEAKAHDLESTARPALDQLTRSISTRSLELVRMVKSQLTHLSARVQKVRVLFHAHFAKIK